MPNRSNTLDLMYDQANRTFNAARANLLRVITTGGGSCAAATAHMSASRFATFHAAIGRLQAHQRYQELRKEGVEGKDLLDALVYELANAARQLGQGAEPSETTKVAELGSLVLIVLRQLQGGEGVVI